MTPKIPRSLEEALRDGRAIPFVGAGVSMAVERVGGGRIFPSWKQLLLDGAARLEQEGRNAGVVRALLEDEEPDYLQAAKRLRDKLGPLWGPFLKDAIDVSRTDTADESLALARAVWRLGSRLVITTNYDQVLRWSCPEEWRDDLKIWDVNAPAEQAEYLRRGELRAPTVWHLHGHIDNAASLILTPDGYATLYPAAGESEPRHQAALETLRHLLASRSFLFVGFSLDDEHFGVELRRMLDTFEGFGGPHYALVHQRHVERLRALGSPVELVAFEDFGEPLLGLLGELSRHVDPARDLGPVDVYLAEVADSQRQLRRRVHDDLAREGVSVAWNLPPPFDAEEHRQGAVAVLKRARLSVHLLDGYAGREVDGKPETTYPQEQVRLARDQARSQLVWVPRPLPEVDDTQQALLTELRSGDRGTSRHHFHEGMPPSELVQDILARLRQDRPLPEQPRAVLLDGHPKDEKVLAQIEGFLREHGVMTYVHRPQADPRRDTERLTERLRTVGALVVCHGEVEENWVGSRLAEAVKAVFNTACPLKLFCAYVAPPEKDLRLYERFQWLDKFELLLNQKGPPEASTFAPLFEKLGVGSTS
ncbi:MAG TPA: SIR2 family protein [Thermoanaerobaculia bacterium]|nr:SIR2 family protein [Thermoanaerobaculia bacterium]